MCLHACLHLPKLPVVAKGGGLYRQGALASDGRVRAACLTRGDTSGAPSPPSGGKTATAAGLAGAGSSSSSLGDGAAAALPLAVPAARGAWYLSGKGGGFGAPAAAASLSPPFGRAASSVTHPAPGATWDPRAGTSPPAAWPPATPHHDADDPMGPFGLLALPDFGAGSGSEGGPSSGAQSGVAAAAEGGSSDWL